MSIKVYALLHPFKSERIERDIEAGKSLRWIIADMAPAAKPTRFRAFVNDEYTADLSRIPKDGDRVALRAIPAGGDVDVMDIVGGGLFAVGLGLMFVPGMQGVGLYLMGTGTTIILGQIAIDQGWFVPDVKIPTFERPQGAPQIRGSRNGLTPYAPVPVVLGKHILIPPLGSTPYTTQSADAQYLNQLFILGYGPLQVSDIRIGETQIFELPGGEIPADGSPFIGESTVYEECTVEIRHDDVEMTLVPNQVAEATVNVELLEAEAPTTRDTELGTGMIDVDIVFPQGLVTFGSKGQKGVRSVEVKAYYKVFGAADETYVLFPGKGALADNYTFSGATTEVIRYTFTKYGLTAGQYTVKVERVTADTDNTKIYDAVYFSYMRSYAMADNVAAAVREKIVRLAIRCKATNQLNGVIDRLSLLAESLVPDYDGTGTGAAEWVSGVTSNPASLYLYMLRGEPNSDPVPDARIDWPAFEAWHTWCAAEGFECNAVLNKGEPLVEVLRYIASTGRASPSMIDGKYSIVHDIAKTAIVQHFTPRNSADFQGAKAFRDIPHALKIGFVNADVGYQADECIVYADGYTALNATKFETIQLWGVTDYDQAWRIGRYKLAEALLRPELFTVSVDWENLICTRGDRVKLSHDVILVGLCAGRVKALTQEATITAITVDEPCVMEVGTTYAVRIRTAAGTLLKAVNTVAGSNTTLTFTVPAALGDLAAGDLYSFGETDLETIDCIVVGIEPQSDFAARLSLVEYAAGVFTADSGAIPAWTSNITVPADLPYAPQAPTILSARSDGTVLIRQPDGTWIVRVLVTIAPVSGLVTVSEYELNYKTKDTDEEWKVIRIPADQTQFWISPAEELFTYSLRVRSISQAGVFSDWATSEHLVVGKTGAPQDVANVYAAVRGVEGIQLSWDAVTDQDISHYVVAVGASWAAGVEIFSGLALSFLWEVQTAATYHVMVKAVDTSGHESVTEAYTDAVIAAPGAVQSLVGVVSGYQAILAWAPPATGSLPVKEYEIYKGDVFATAEYLGKVSGTKFNVLETAEATIKYWVVAVDQADNEGTEDYVSVVVAGKLSTAVYYSETASSVTETAFDGAIRAVQEALGYSLESHDGTNWNKLGAYSVVATPKAVASCYYRFSENMADASGNRHDATVFNAPAYVDWLYGKAIDLNGTDQYASIPNAGLVNLRNPGVGNESTVEIWLKPDTLSTGMTMFDVEGKYVFYTTTASGYTFRTPYGNVGDLVESTTPLVAGQLDHFVLVISGLNCKLYRNGALDKEVTLSVAPAAWVPTCNGLLGCMADYAGDMNDPGGEFFDGKICRLRIFDSIALSAADVAALYANTVKAALEADRIGTKTDPGLIELVDGGVKINGGVAAQMLYVEEQQAANTAGGTFTLGAWRTRVLNTEVLNTLPGASLASNQVTLPAGTYWIEAAGPAAYVNGHRTKIYDITNSADLLIGRSHMCVASGGNSDTVLNDYARVEGKIVLTAATVIELQHYCNTSRATNGLGYATNIGGLVEKYSYFKATRLA